METDVELSGDSESYVCQDLEPCQAMYYFHALIDVDGDGWICPGDLVPDYGMAPSQSYSMEDLTSQDHEVYVKTKIGSDSDCIQPSNYYQELEPGA
jgi:hypothetical protein